MKKAIPPSENNVAMEFRDGNTRIKICDDYCRNSDQEDINDILTRIAAKCLPVLINLEDKKTEENFSADD